MTLTDKEKYCLLLGYHKAIGDTLISVGGEPRMTKLQTFIIFKKCCDVLKVKDRLDTKMDDEILNFFKEMMKALEDDYQKSHKGALSQEGYYVR